MTTDRGITTAQTYAAEMARPGDEVAAGDGLGAVGVALILPVQVHFIAGREAAGQWICTKQGHSQVDLKADKQDRQIQHRTTSWPRSRAWRLWASPQPLPADSCSTTAAAGEQLSPPPIQRPRSGGRRRLADARHGAAVAR